MTLDPRKLNSDHFTFADDDIAEDSSVYTLEDEMENTHINTSSPIAGDPDTFHIYDLPTHISSHRDLLNDGSPRTQPTTPVSTPYQERPNHPLRALTSTHLVLNQSNGTDDSLITLETPPVSRGPSNASALKPGLDYTEPIQENNEDWDKEGSAQIIKQETNELTGETEEIVIRRSVKDFKFGEALGVGSYSTVLLATDKNTDRKFAVKVLDKRHIIREKKVKYVNIEKNTLNRLGKRNGLIHLFFTFQDESSLYFVLDYAQNGELLNLIKEHGTLNEETTRYYGAQIIDAVKYMHDNGVVHRDLKPENILLDSKNKVQITDFGTAKLLEKNDAGRYPSDTKAKSFVGTAEYVSPELLNEKAIGKACDIWAFGCIIYQMIAGKPPFKAPNDYLTFQKIVKLQFAFTAGFPMSCRDLIKRVLVLNPQDRYTIKEIQQHHFFQSIDFNNPEESIWRPDPPEIGPYKINAKSMLPIPGLDTRPKIYLPSKRNASNSSTSVPITTESSSLVDESSSSTTLQQTQSQQVLAKAKATVAARKQSESNKRVVSGAGNAANAATVALSRQPDQIIKAYNEKQEKDRKVKQELEKNQTIDDVKTPPLSSSSQFKESPQQELKPSLTTTNSSATPKARSASSYKTTLRERKKPSTSNNAPYVVSPMTRLDLEFANYLRNVDERILKKGELNLQITATDAIERKYKGRLLDSPLGGNKSSTSSLLSQVASGSSSGLRSHDNGEYSDTSTSIIKNHQSESDDRDNIGAKAKFRKFFGGGGADENEKKLRTLVTTTEGRVLIFIKNVEKDDTLELKTEIDITNASVKIRELLPPVIKSANTGGLFVIEVHNSAFVFETSQFEITSWTEALYNAKLISSEISAMKHLREDPAGDAGTILGSDAAKSAANLATINSPPLSPISNGSNELKSPVMLNLTKNASTSPKSPARKQPTGSLRQKPSNLRVGSSSQGTSSTGSKHEGMFKELVKSRTSQRQSSKRELPNNGKLHFGLPLSSNERNTGQSETSSRNTLIAAASAAVSRQLPNSSTASNVKPRTSRGSRSSSSDTTTGASSNSMTGKQHPNLITGMNSRLLARSHDKRKK